MSSGSRRAPVRIRPSWLVLTLAALFAVPLLAVPAGAAPPVTSITNVTVTGTAEGTGDCLWRMEVTVENFRGGGKYFTASLGGPPGSRLAYLASPTINVKGKATSLVWEIRQSLTYFPSVANWGVNVGNKKAPQDSREDVLLADIECKSGTA